MVQPLTHLQLAAGLLADAWVRVVPFLIILTLWVIGAIAAAMKKAGKRADEESSSLLEELDRPVPWAPPTVKAPPIPPAAKPKSKRKRKREAMAPPPLPLSATGSAPSTITSRNVTTTAQGSPSALNSAAIRQWLTPDVLRSQYVVTEILDPPAALRSPDREPGGE